MPIALLPLRIAEQKDFFDNNNKPRYGVPFFLKSTSGNFDQMVYYLKEDTDKEDFKIWFRNKQIYVVSSFLDELSVLDQEKK